MYVTFEPIGGQIAGGDWFELGDLNGDVHRARSRELEADSRWVDNLNNVKRANVTSSQLT